MAPFGFLIWLCVLHCALAKGSEPRVECTKDTMKVTVPMDGDRKLTYLDQMRDYSSCKPKIENGVAIYVLDLQDPHRCGVTRVINKITDKRTYYHKIVIEESTGLRETVTTRCVFIPHGAPRVKRDESPLPLDFHEPEVVTLTDMATEHAPDPQLGAAVKQDGKQVSGEISVSPGTPLSMEIFLDNTSAPIYGLMVSYMHVTDTDKQQETIIFNGCSVDPYVFDNFLTDDGKLLRAKFRAFKFPDSTYVQFKATVLVCLDKCRGVECSNGVTAYGRRRRAVDAAASNRLYEVALTTFIKVEGDNQGPDDLLAQLKNLKIENQMLEGVDGTPATVAERTPDNKLVVIPTVVTAGGNGSAGTAAHCITSLLTVIAILLW